MSDREGYVELMEFPEDEQNHPMSNNFPAFDDGRARSKTELEYFDNAQGAKLGINLREPLREEGFNMGPRY